jgi:hypothetical protein
MVQPIAHWQAWWRGEDVLDSFALSASLRSSNLIPLLLSGKGSHPPYHLLPKQRSWWRGEDSNLRRHRQQIYSLSPLAAREPLRL